MALTERQWERQHSYAYRAGYQGVMAHYAKRGTVCVSPSQAERDYWATEWAAFMRGWRDAQREAR